MGMESINSIVPIFIHSLIESGVMYILQRPIYNNITVKSEWEKVMALRGYEDGLVIDNSGVVENFINTIRANCYKQI